MDTHQNEPSSFTMTFAAVLLHACALKGVSKLLQGWDLALYDAVCYLQ
jgi:hypothetical protein